MNQLATRNGVVTEDAATGIKAILDNPYCQLPPEWVPLVFDFWSFWSDVLKNELGLCSRIRYWMSDEGLTLDVLKRAITAEKRTEAAAGIHFPSEILAGLARRIQTLKKADADEKSTAEFTAQFEGQLIATRLAEAFRRPGVSPVKPVE